MSLPRRRQAIIARRQKRRPRPSLRSRSCIIDGEAVACDDNGIASFDLIRHQAAIDPVGAGLVASLARPGGNATGLSLQSLDLAGKRLSLLREVVPGLRRVAFIGNTD